MATINTSAVTGSDVFKPAFNRVAQSGDFDDIFACLATVFGKTLEEVRGTAIQHFRHPEHGQYYIDETLIASICSHYGWVSTVWKPVVTPISGLPDLALLMIDYDENKELGHTVVFNRIRSSTGSKPPVEYVIDVAGWIPPEKFLQLDLKSLQPAWFIGLHAMQKTAGKVDK